MKTLNAMRLWRPFSKWPLKVLFMVFYLPAAFLPGTLRAGDAPQFPPASRIGLVPPTGFVVSPDFTGFMDREAVASIVITEMPKEAYGDLEAGFTEDNLAAQGMALQGPCPDLAITFEHRCFRASQEASGYLFQKWFLIARLGTETALVLVTMPDLVLQAGVYSEAVVEAALSSIAYSEDLTTDPLEVLPFAIAEGDLLPFKDTMGGSAALFVGEATAEGPQPAWIVAASLGPGTNAANIEFGRLAFQEIATVLDARVTEERRITVGPLAGHVLEGTGTDEVTGDDLFVFQAILVDAEDTYYRLVGLAPMTQKELYRPEFFRLTQTLEPR
ncbi:MAG: hypothetical protein GY791_03500 [Alphaproteobacteria bacterium]|nr:hypothetical protein [Alphaproteobacteria bacterium]